MAEKVRIDKYLWCIRVFKTRTQATDAINQGRVRVDGSPVKPSRQVSLGDCYDIRTPHRKWTIQVTGWPDHRVGYDEAQSHYVDLTSEEDRMASQKQQAYFFTGKRLSKTGRPTKKQRRDLSDFWGETGDSTDQ